MPQKRESTSSHLEDMTVADERGFSPTPDSKGAPDIDHNNPQNWTTSAKLTTYLTICAFTFLANVNSSNFTVATKAIIHEFGVSQTQAGELVCFNVFLFGLGNIIWVPLMRVVGKRPVYLLALLTLSMMNVWSSQATSYKELLASRILSGFPAAAADATVPAVVGDMVAPHDRGHYLMIFHLSMTSGLFLGPLINAYLVQEENWRWMCYFLAIAVGVVFLVSIFTIRETTYLKRDSGGKRSHWQWMSVTLGYDRNASFIRTLSDILACASYPQLLWCAFNIGISMGWNIVVQLTSSKTFTAAPYNWPIGNLGLLSISGFIGCVLAFYVAGRLIDIISTRYANRHGGHRLPEYRLPALLIPGTIGPAGILTFGLCIAYDTPWIGAAFGYGMQAFGVAAISNVAVTYSLDCYKPVTGEALVIIFVIRNTIGMLLSLYGSNWIERQGAAAVFGEMTAIQVAALLLAIPLFFYGKRLRTLTSRYGPMKRFNAI